MMSRPDFMYKQIIFYQVTEKERLYFRADNLIIEDSKKSVKPYLLAFFSMTFVNEILPTINNANVR